MGKEPTNHPSHTYIILLKISLQPFIMKVNNYKLILTFGLGTMEHSHKPSEEINMRKVGDSVMEKS